MYQKFAQAHIDVKYENHTCRDLLARNAVATAPKFFEKFTRNGRCRAAWPSIARIVVLPPLRPGMAMPLLHLAGRVSIFAASQYDIDGVDPVDLADSLSWHGIRALPVVGPKDEHATGAALVSAACEQRATLIVMGAYTDSRLRQSFLGGVTRHLLAHAPVPLLMSH